MFNAHSRHIYKLEDLSYIMMSEVIGVFVLVHKVIYKDNIIYYWIALQWFRAFQLVMWLFPWCCPLKLSSLTFRLNVHVS